MPPDKIIFDTNIFVSLAINRDMKFISSLAYKFNIQLIVCEELFFELEEVLERPKFSKYNIDTKSVLELVKMYSSSVKIHKHISRLSDTDDNYLVDMALASKIKLVVTGDKPLLKIKKHHGVEFISFSTFKGMLPQ